MANFYVRTVDLANTSNKLMNICNRHTALYSDIHYVRNRIDDVINVRSTVGRRLSEALVQCREHEHYIRKLCDALSEISILYEKAEENIAGLQRQKGQTTGEGQKPSIVQRLIDYIKDLFGWDDEPSSPTEIEIDSIVFDDDGDYGGDQGAPQHTFGKEREELYAIVRKYYPKMEDHEIQEYLQKLNDEGCGYTAVINTIFAAYEGREAEFEEKFGFPMYENGDLNYNKLLVDYYSATDNHNKGFFGNDYVKHNEDVSTTDGYGTTQDSRKYRTEMYLSDKGIPVDITTDYRVTPENFAEASKDGYVIIAYHDGYLQYEDGSYYSDRNGNPYKIGAHAMVITGVTEDGRYIVSSWGKKFYIDPYETMGGEKASMTYSYYQYN